MKQPPVVQGVAGGWREVRHARDNFLDRSVSGWQGRKSAGFGSKTGNSNQAGDRGNNIRFLSENVTVQALYLEPQNLVKPIKFMFRDGANVELATFTLIGHPLVLPYASAGWFISDDGLVLSADGPIIGLIVYE